MRHGRVGMVGLGQMGFPIAARLLDRGDPVVFHARRADVAAALTNLGATRAESLKALAETSDVVILCVYDEAQVRQVCLGEDGLLSHLSPGSILINHTTCDPNTLQLLDEQAEATGVGVVDAALSGSPADIGEGHLTLWVGGRPDLLEAIDPIMRSYADPVIHVGMVGDGQWVKLVNNALFAGNVALVSSAERVLNQAGLSTVQAMEAIRHGSGDSRALGLVSRLGGSEPLVREAGRFIRKDVETVLKVATDRQIELGVLGQVAGSVGGRGMTPSAERLWDVEQIKQLKARYFRYLDTKDWDAFETLFTDGLRPLPSPGIGKSGHLERGVLCRPQIDARQRCHHTPRTHAGDHPAQRYRGRGHLGHVRLRANPASERSCEHPGLRALLRDVPERTRRNMEDQLKTECPTAPRPSRTS